jgi:5-methyltetrahydropteroyltriglutamate--homocysteine methyltransferase
MMRRSDERILTTHVGSLIRPPELGGSYSSEYGQPPSKNPAEKLRLRRAVEEVVRRQAEIGIDIVNDGEYGHSG